MQQVVRMFLWAKRLTLGAALVLAAAVCMGPSCEEAPPAAQSPGVQADFEDAYASEGREPPPRVADRAAARQAEVD